MRQTSKDETTSDVVKQVLKITAAGLIWIPPLLLAVVPQVPAPSSTPAGSGVAPIAVAIKEEPSSFVPQLIATLTGALVGGFIAADIAKRSEKTQLEAKQRHEVELAYSEYIASMHLMALYEDRLLDQVNGVDLERNQYLAAVSNAIAALDRAAFVDMDTSRVSLARKAFSALDYRVILHRGRLSMHVGNDSLGRAQASASIRNARDLLLHQLKLRVASSREMAVNFEPPRDERMPEHQDMDVYIRVCRDKHVQLTGSW